VDNYTSDAEKENKSDLVGMWNTIKQDRTRHFADVTRGISKGSKTRKIDAIVAD
jgi:hypothetical protein